MKRLERIARPGRLPSAIPSDLSWNGTARMLPAGDAPALQSFRRPQTAATTQNAARDGAPKSTLRKTFFTAYFRLSFSNAGNHDFAAQSTHSRRPGACYNPF